MSTVSEKRSTELRLLTATLFFRALNGGPLRWNSDVTDLDPQAPVIPITATTPFGTLHEAATEHFRNGATHVYVPVITPDNLTLSVITLDREDVDSLSASAPHTAHSLFELITPKRSFALQDLYPDRPEEIELLSRNLSRLSAN